MPDTVVIVPGPSTLRRAATCTETLFSSTTSPGQAASRSSPLVTTWPARTASTHSRSKARLPTVVARPSTSSRRSEGRISHP